MKITNKRLVSILLCLAMVLAVLPMAVFAADTTTVYYYNASNWSTVSVYWWGSAGSNPGWPGNTMTDLGNGYWSYEIPSDLVGKEGVIFNNANGAQTANLTMPTTGENCFNGSSWIEYTGEEIEVVIDYYLRGEMNGWDTSAKMTDNGDGTYSITMTLAAGTYQYKAAIADWSWSCPAGDNASVTVASDCDVTFVLDVAANTVVASGSGIDDSFVSTDYYVAGSAGLCGSEWSVADEANKMVESGNGVYEITYTNVAAGGYEFKVTNGSWNQSWGNPSGPNGNYVIDVEVTSDVTIVFDKETEYITVEIIADASADFPSDYIKWQLNVDANAGSETVDVRLIAGLDSLDYDNVYFVVNGTEYACEAVYASINEYGDPVAASDIFEGAAYVATYTITGVSISESIVASVIYEADGVLNETIDRIIVIPSAF